MKWNDIFCNTFKSLRSQIGSEVKKQVNLMLPSMPMVEACRTNDLDSFQPFIAAGLLTGEDMHQACNRYYLGKTKTGSPIFWMIDDLHRPLDAHIGTTWLSTLLKHREPLIKSWHVEHCLFGLHLLANPGPGATVTLRSRRPAMQLGGLASVLAPSPLSSPNPLP